MTEDELRAIRERAEKVTPRHSPAALRAAERIHAKMGAYAGLREWLVDDMAREIDRAFAEESADARAEESALRAVASEVLTAFDTFHEKMRGDEERATLTWEQAGPFMDMTYHLRRLRAALEREGETK